MVRVVKAVTFLMEKEPPIDVRELLLRVVRAPLSLQTRSPEMLVGPSIKISPEASVPMVTVPLTVVHDARAEASAAELIETSDWEQISAAETKPMPKAAKAGRMFLANMATT
jgi:hypothetical protein